MRIRLDTSSLRTTRWYQYLVRFLFGAIVTVAAALIAKKFGPGIGGLFLAFPAIFPATATLIASHEKQKNAQAGMNGSVRARQLAGADAGGATMGAVGLVAFAAITRWLISGHSIVFALSIATLSWMAVSFLIWEARESVWRRVRARLSKSHASQGAHRETAVENGRRPHE